MVRSPITQLAMIKVPFLFSAAAFCAATLSITTASAQQRTLFSDDFSEANGTLINNKPADIGGNITVTEGGADLDIQAGSVETQGARRVINFPFTQPITANDILTVTVGYLESGGTFFSGGFAGFRLMAGATTLTEVGFFGDPSNSTAGYYVGASSAGTGGFQSTQATEPGNLVFTYVYNTGAATLSFNGTQLGTTTLAAAQPIRALQAENNGGGDQHFTSVVATAVPEPTTALMGVFAGTGLLALRRRRSA